MRRMSSRWSTARALGARRAGREVEDRVQLLAVRERDVELEEEAIELRLGQRIGALHLERVLRREDEERLVEHVRALADGDAVLLHRLEQRALRLRRRAVDLVGEHDVREDRSLPELEHLAARLRVVDDRGAEDVGRHQVGRELHARELQAQRLGERRTSIVLPRPGTPSSSAWPPASRHMSTPSTTARCRRSSWRSRPSASRWTYGRRRPRRGHHRIRSFHLQDLPDDWTTESACTGPQAAPVAGAALRRPLRAAGSIGNSDARRTDIRRGSRPC